MNSIRTLNQFDELLEKSLSGTIGGLIGIESPRTGSGLTGERPEPTLEGKPYRALEVL